MISCAQVIESVASFYKVAATDIKGPRRHKSFVQARHVAMYLARQLTAESYPELARSFGGRHHTTVIEAVRRMEARYESDDRFCLQLSAIRRLLERKEAA